MTARTAAGIVPALSLWVAALPNAGCERTEPRPPKRRTEARDPAARSRTPPPIRTPRPRKTQPAKTPEGWPEPHRLENGLRAYVLPSPSGGHVSVLLAFGLGAAHDPDGQTGLTHLIEHLLIRAPIAGVDGGEVADLKPFAVDLNGETLSTFSYVYAVGRTGNLEPLVRTWAGRWRFLTFDAKTIGTDLGRMLKEKSFVERSGQARLFNAVFRAAYVKSKPHRWGKLSLLETKGPFKAENAERFFKAHYVASRAVVVVAGDVVPGPAVRLVRKYLGSVRPGTPPALATIRYTPLKRPPPRISVTSPGITGWHLLSVWPAPPWLSKQDAALTEAGLLLQQRLYRKLVAPGSLTTAFAQNDVLSGPGHLFTVQLSGSNDAMSPQQALDALRAEIKGLVTDPLPVQPAHLSEAYRLNLHASVRLGRMGGGHNAWAAAVQSSINLSRVELTLGERRVPFLREISSVTSAEIRRTAKRYLAPGKMVAGTLTAPQP